METTKRVTIAEKYNGLTVLSPLYNLGIDPVTRIAATETINIAIRIPLGYAKIIRDNALLRLHVAATSPIEPIGDGRAESVVEHDRAKQAVYLAAHEAGAWFFGLSEIVERQIANNEAIYCSDFEALVADITLRMAPVLAELKFCEGYIALGVVSDAMLASVAELKVRLASLEAEKKAIIADSAPTQEQIRTKAVAKMVTDYKKPNRMGASFFKSEEEWLEFANRRYNELNPAVVAPEAKPKTTEEVKAEGFEDELTV